MKKKIALTGLLILSSLLFASHLTGQIYQDVLGKQLELIKQQPGIELQIRSARPAPFQRHEHYTLTLHDPNLDSPITLVIIQQLQFWPLLVKGSTHIDFVHSSLALLEGTLSAPKQHSQWHASILGNRGAYRYQLEPMTLVLSPQNRIELGSLTLSGAFHLDLSHWDLALQWQDMNLIHGEHTLTFEQLGIELDATLIDDIYDMPRTALTLAALSYQDEQDTDLTLTGLSLHANIDDKRREMQIRSDLNIDQLALHWAREELELKLNQFTFHNQVDGINSALYRRFLALSQLPPQQASFEMELLIRQLLQQGARWQLDQLQGQITLALPNQHIDGQLYTAGHIELLGMPSSYQRSLLAALEVDLDIHFNDSLFAQHPLADMVAHLKAKQKLNTEHALWQTRFQFQQGTASFSAPTETL
ncbi:DUF945 family protein [Ferrimonas pelagia]|uniref:AsmA-like C-terminal domain-containing protein n=1 Tax=Ferrimonas pelagia TaxID=1177826 RepID=A0ABP9EFG0_9GAMM